MHKSSARAWWAVLALSLTGHFAQQTYLVRDRRRTDADTESGLLGRRAWDRQSSELFHQLQVRSDYGAVVLIDIDGLKNINDRLGHAAGDRAIAAVGTAIRNAVRRADIAARLGGDEFVVMVPDATMSDCISIAMRIRERLAAQRDDSGAPQVSVSIGCATYPNDGVEINEVLAAADRRLYREKRHVRAPHRLSHS